MSSEPLLRVGDLHTHFETPRGRVRAVDGVSFAIRRGQTLGIVGESGCGKSVLSRTIMGLLPSTARVPAETSIRFDGQELRGLSERALRQVRGRHMAMIFQDPMTSLNPVMTCGAQLVESLTHHLRLGRRQARDRAIELFAAVGIPEPERRVDHYPHQLSGGMRQRVAIAIALACEPALLIADEPTTALDVTVQAEILDLLKLQQRERNMALILITHDLGVVAGRTDEVAVMYAGRIVERADTGTLFAETRMPYTAALLRSIPRLSDPAHTRLETIAGRPPELIDPPPGCRFAPRCRYAADDCRGAAPALVGADVDGGHAYACWHPLGSGA
ncbi:MAG: ABC transporter ATP-binding protein [Alphaproteobacteria bacterium]